MDDQKQNKDEAKFLDDYVVTVKGSQDDQELLPELKRLPAVIKQIKEKAIRKSNNIRAHFTFVISAGKFKDRYAWGSVPLHADVTNKADLYKWICAILGKELTANDNVRLGELVGKSVEIMIKNTKAGIKTYQNVTEVLTAEGAVEKSSTVVKEEPKPASDTTPEVVDDPLASLNEEEVKESPKEESPAVEDDISEDDLPF